LPLSVTWSRDAYFRSVISETRLYATTVGISATETSTDPVQPSLLAPPDVVPGDRFGSCSTMLDLTFLESPVTSALADRQAHWQPDDGPSVDAPDSATENYRPILALIRLWATQVDFKVAVMAFPVLHGLMP